jgi:hypothetical protein
VEVCGELKQVARVITGLNYGARKKRGPLLQWLSGLFPPAVANETVSLFVLPRICFNTPPETNFPLPTTNKLSIIRTSHFAFWMAQPLLSELFEDNLASGQREGVIAMKNIRIIAWHPLSLILGLLKGAWKSTKRPNYRIETGMPLESSREPGLLIALIYRPPFS